MKKGLKYLFIFLAVIVAGAIISWFVLMNAPKASVKKKSVDISIVAEQLFKEYSADEAAGDKKYISQIIQVKGKIVDLYADEQGAPVVLLGLSDETLGGVLCTFELNEKEKLNTFAVGDSITVKGSCSGLLMEVVLNRCVVAK